MGVAQQACEMRAGVVVGAECWRMHCDIWCGRVFYFQRDWLWTSGGLLVVSECVVVSGQSMLRPTF